MALVDSTGRWPELPVPLQDAAQLNNKAKKTKTQRKKKKGANGHPSSTDKTNTGEDETVAFSPWDFPSAAYSIWYIFTEAPMMNE